MCSGIFVILMFWGNFFQGSNVIFDLKQQQHKKQTFAVFFTQSQENQMGLEALQ